MLEKRANYSGAMELYRTCLAKILLYEKENNINTSEELSPVLKKIVLDYPSVKLPIVIGCISSPNFAFGAGKFTAATKRSH